MHPTLACNNQRLATSATHRLAAMIRKDGNTGDLLEKFNIDLEQYTANLGLLLHL
jgi:hypothetical protein